MLRATNQNKSTNNNDVIMSTMVSQITNITIVDWTVYSGTDQWNAFSETGPWALIQYKDIILSV